MYNINIWTLDHLDHLDLSMAGESDVFLKSLMRMGPGHLATDFMGAEWYDHLQKKMAMIYT